MGKQKTMTAGRKAGGSHGRGGPKGRSSQAATPKPGPKLRFKPLQNRPDSSAQQLDASAGYGGKVDQHDDLPQQYAQPALVTTRTGREIHKPQHYDDVVQGSDMDAFIDLNSDDFRDIGRDFMASDPPYITHQKQEQCQQAPKPRGRPLKNSTLFNTAVGKVDEEDEVAPSSSTLQAKSPPADDSAFIASDEAYSVLNALRVENMIHLDLPCLSKTHDPTEPLPYSAKTLTHLYILCYQEELWDLCDMITDTWIRAFHSQRKKGETDPDKQVWRPNPALIRRKRKQLQAWAKGQNVPCEFDPNPKDYELIVTDPELDEHVISVNTDLLNTLYENTAPRCGARLLWADALALGGNETEHIIQVVTQRGFPLHPQLLFDIMQTSLRMVRRNLTLKIEESTEGAWCKRYHEHGKNKTTCYRERASEVGCNDDEEDGEGCIVDLELLKEFEAGLAEEEGEVEGVRAGKRGREGDDGGGTNKRIRFVGEDLDAEDESE